MMKRTGQEIVLSNLPAKLVDDLRAWARRHRRSPEKAALELLRVGLDVASDETQTALAAAAKILRQAKARRV